jgi:Mn-containing catalase
MLMDIATEELSHLEIIGSLVGMLNKGAKGELAEGTENEAELYRSLTQNGNDSHVTSLLYGGGPALTNSAGYPWTAAYIDTIGEVTADLRSNIAAEARAKIIYERLINVTDDPGVKDALSFLMTREAAHMLSLRKRSIRFATISRRANCRLSNNTPTSITTCPKGTTRVAVGIVMKTLSTLPIRSLPLTVAMV